MSTEDVPSPTARVMAGVKGRATFYREKSLQGLEAIKHSAAVTAAAARGREPPPAYQPSVDLPPPYPDSQSVNTVAPESDAAQENPLPPGVADFPVRFDVEPDRRERRRSEGLIKHVALLCCLFVLFGGWIAWIAIPSHYVSSGRHHVKNNWTPSTCTITAQSCYKKCSWGHSKHGNCCGGPDDCIRDGYFLSQNCVWLSQTKYDQLEDYTAKYKAPDDLAPSLRLTPTLGLMSGLCGVLIFGGVGRGTRLALILVILLCAVGSSEARDRDGTAFELVFFAIWVPVVSTISKPSFAVSITVGSIIGEVTKTVECGQYEADNDFCKGLGAKIEWARVRDRKCKSVEDMEKEECQLETLNVVNTTRTCWVNPDDTSELEVVGSKGWGASSFNAITSWACFTFLLLVTVCLTTLASA